MSEQDQQRYRISRTFSQHHGQGHEANGAAIIEISAQVINMKARKRGYKGCRPFVWRWNRAFKEIGHGEPVEGVGGKMKRG